MLLPPFQYHRPAELAAAHDLMARFGDEASAYAGGTEVLLAMKARVLRYAHLVDLKHIAALNGIRQDRGALVVGALTSHFRLATDPLIRRLIPAYAALSDGIANIRVRVAGTLGGNLCFAEPHADPPALLAALGASVTLRSAEATRAVPVAAFIEGEFTTVRRDDELLTEIRIPIPGVGERFCYRSFGHLERPAVGIAAGCIPHEGAFRYRVWAGAIAGRPIRLESLEKALQGVPPADVMEVLPKASVAAAGSLPAQSDLHGSADYKQHLAAVFMRRAVAEAAGVPLEERDVHA
jgi:aerobic carbon-monoxide dehydrogenase medium subunit